MVTTFTTRYCKRCRMAGSFMQVEGLGFLHMCSTNFTRLTREVVALRQHIVENQPKPKRSDFRR